MRRLTQLFILMWMWIPVVVWAQDPQLRVSCKSEVSVGEQFQVVFEIDADGSDFQSPSFDGMRVVGGPFSSSSSSVQIINGKMSRSYQKTYKLILSAPQEGQFTIGSASVKVDGKKIVSEPFEVTVVASSTNASSNNNSNNSTSSASNEPELKGKDLFIKVIPSKKKVFVGEQVLLTYKIYSKVPVSQLSLSKPSYAGFWVKDVDNGNNSGALQQSSEYVNGEEYISAVLYEVVVVPQKSGVFEIDPLVVNCVVQLQNKNSGRRSNDPFDAFFNDPFFSRSYVNVNKELRTKSLQLEVRSLPTANRPESFDNAVGQYTFSAAVDREELKTNEAITLTLIVKGNGNIDLVDIPRPILPPDFEVYDPKVTLNAKAQSQGLSGTKKAEYLIIPRAAGTFDIPSISFSFFNPKKGVYEELKSDSFSISVEKGSASESSNLVYSSNQEDIKYIGSDIRHIMTGDAHLVPIGSTFFNTWCYYLLLILPFVVLAVLLIVHRRQAETLKDQSLMRNKKATKVAKARLKKAHDYMKDNQQDQFYVEMSQALWGYISDKLNMSRSSLSIENVETELKSKTMPEELVQRFVEALGTCEYARFAPGDADSKMENLYQEGIEIISQSERVL